MAMLVGLLILAVCVFSDFHEETAPHHSQKWRKKHNDALQDRHHNKSIPVPKEWLIEMPTKSLFNGMGPPRHREKWQRAIRDAAEGEQVLLLASRRAIHSATDVLDGDIRFRWLHKFVDVLLSRQEGMFKKLEQFKNIERAPIAMLGYHQFEKGVGEGDVVKHMSLGPDSVANKKVDIPRKVVAVGCMDENWGWASTHFLNRTASWGLGIVDTNPFRSTNFPDDELKQFLDNPNLIMLLVNQHHNITHPKVVSIPRGMLKEQAQSIWRVTTQTVQNGMRKRYLLFTAATSYGARMMIIDCVNKSMNGEAVLPRGRVDEKKYHEFLSLSYAVLCVPGLGYDTFRLWETLLSGSMPIIERGVGLDRSTYKLPVLLVDDFAYVTPELVRAAYVEALYHADKWDYKRITQRWWEKMLIKVSENGTTAALSKLFPPLKSYDPSFTRPLVPFDCKKMDGCGAGTKRVPEKSCVVDFDFPMRRYNWAWAEDLIWLTGAKTTSTTIYLPS